MSIGANIKKYRIDRGLNQDDLGKYLGKSKGVISKWEKGENKPDAETIINICKYLDITPNTLFDWKAKNNSTYNLLLKEQKLIDMFRELNPEGQEILLDTIDTLVTSKKYDKYTNDNNPSNDVYDESIEMIKEVKKYDKKIYKTKISN